VHRTHTTKAVSSELRKKAGDDERTLCQR
jgi:hypothetical protein